MKKVKNDNTNKVLSILYDRKIGRFILKPLVSSSIISNFVGFLLDRKISCILIKRFVKNNNIDINLFEDKKYKSFNEFFIRKIKLENRPYSKNKKDFISPCDSKLSIYKIDENTNFNIKNTTYSVSTLINDKMLSKEYLNGYVMVFRLSPEDYHRYYYIDNGKVIKNYKIKGKFHTVNPIVYDKFEVFKENSRECTIIDTENYGRIIYVEVGALLVGKICNHNKNILVNKMDEKGYFKYGGSTVVLLVKENVLNIDKEILNNSNNGYETYVNLGEKLAEKRK